MAWIINKVELDPVSAQDRIPGSQALLVVCLKF